MADKTKGCCSSPWWSSELWGAQLLLLPSLPRDSVAQALLAGSAPRNKAFKHTLIQVDTIHVLPTDDGSLAQRFHLCVCQKGSWSWEEHCILHWKAAQRKKKSWRPTSSTYFVFEVSPLSTDLPLLSLADHPVMLSFGKEIPGANLWLHSWELCLFQAAVETVFPWILNKDNFFWVFPLNPVARGRGRRVTTRTKLSFS